ncbi:MAG: 4-hydroxy-tetrahydrodipicolinate reductase [Cytophagales bacterium]|nr:4-hydroxy-tetrahydrodipicolinate reductase [Bernardetiaceae bacterium]MDW8209843.1 4-hydroxy-tetrahydrodipicolinate reductase [Cytophagales bacterium]
MKILLLGYGKMGRAIEAIALRKGHQIIQKIDIHNRDQLQHYRQGDADVAIEFTSPEAVVSNLEFCLAHHLPVVCGTTGWLSEFQHISERFRQHGGALFYAPNYSIGVNILFALNRFLARLMASQPQYRPTIVEVHHTEKKDAPSGTAIALAEAILPFFQSLKGWELTPNAQENQLPITAIRQPDIFGIHTVTYQSTIDTIEIKHVAHSREGFAQGALWAAEWLIGKKGVFGMEDMLSLSLPQ